MRKWSSPQKNGNARKPQKIRKINKPMMHERRRYFRANPEAKLATLELPGEPHLYSCNHAVDIYESNAQHASRHHRFRGFVSAMMPAFYTEDPVVICAKFYVAPPFGHDFTEEQLESETIVATLGEELMDYMLALLQTLKVSLIESYRQIVNVYAIKVYSAHPRTAFKIVYYNEFIKHFHLDPFASDTQGTTEKGQVRLLQSERKKDEPVKDIPTRPVRKGAAKRPRADGA